MGKTNGWTNRLGVIGLATVAPVSIVCASVLILTGHELPQGFWIATAAAVSGLAGLLTHPLKKTD